VSFVLIKFYSHTDLILVIEESVLVFHSSLISLTWRLISGLSNKLTYFENPASVSCVLPVSDTSKTLFSCGKTDHQNECIIPYF